MISLWVVDSDGEIREALDADCGDSDVLVLAVRWRLVTELGTLDIWYNPMNRGGRYQRSP